MALKKTKKKINLKMIFGALILLVFAGGIGFIGYRVVVTSGEVPGRLSSVSTAAANLNYTRPEISKVSKVEYDMMRYGYMDDLLMAQMDLLDKNAETIQMDEIRAVNDLTAMLEKTTDLVEYQQLKEEQDKKNQEAIAAAKAAEEAKKLAMQAKIDARMGMGMVPEDGDTSSNGGRIGEPVYAKTHGESLGDFVITAYCTCKICCGVYSGHNRTASGTIPTTNRTIAVDTSVIPFGTRVVFNGQVYVAEDKGSAIRGKRIDLFFYSHAQATRWGKKTMEVFLAE